MSNFVLFLMMQWKTPFKRFKIANGKVNETPKRKHKAVIDCIEWVIVI